MKPFAAIAALLFAFTGACRANGGENFPFHVGEKLTYQVFWGPFVAGHATLEVDGIETVDGHDCYHFIAQVHTVGLADLLFHVATKNESWLDTAGLFTRRYRENRTEGDHSRSNETHYDYTANLATTTNFINRKVKSTPLDGHVRDIVSTLYYVRTQPLELNVDNNFLVYITGSNYTVNVRPDLRKTVWVRPLGDVSALRIEPQPTLTIVAANKGRMWFWVSDDRRKLPVLLTSDLKYGTAKLVLSQIEPMDASKD